MHQSLMVSTRWSSSWAVSTGGYGFVGSSPGSSLMVGVATVWPEYDQSEMVYRRDKDCEGVDLFLFSGLALVAWKKLVEVRVDY